jgi:redox-sensitive bicupin YhaK (pirin superfamily)
VDDRGARRVHSEHPLATVQHGIQLWTSLPRAKKMMAPRYQRIDAEAIPATPRGGATVRVIAGELDGCGGPPRRRCRSSCGTRRSPGARLGCATPDGVRSGRVRDRGRGTFGPDDAVVAKQGQLVLWEGDAGSLRAANAGGENLELLVFGGRSRRGTARVPRDRS